MTFTDAKDFTMAEYVLLAANTLDRKGQATFTTEDLVIVCWAQWPGTFGLKGYEAKSADSNKVISALVGARGLSARGWLVKIGEKLYSCTKDGRRVAAGLLGEPAPVQNGHPRPIIAAHKEVLSRLLSSTAYRKFEENQKTELAFADACRFWQLADNTTGAAVDEALSALEKTLNEIEQQLATEDGVMHGGRVVRAGDIRLLRNIHRYLVDRFGRHLNLLRSRGGRS